MKKKVNGVMWFLLATFALYAAAAVFVLLPPDPSRSTRSGRESVTGM